LEFYRLGQVIAILDKVESTRLQREHKITVGDRTRVDKLIVVGDDQAELFMIRMVQDSGIVGLAGMVFNCSMYSQNPGQPPPSENQVTFELFSVNVQQFNFISILPMLELSGTHDQRHFP
jgi:hypothetical protein